MEPARRPGRLEVPVRKAQQHFIWPSSTTPGVLIKFTGVKLVFNSAGLANSIAGQKLSVCVSVHQARTFYPETPSPDNFPNKCPIHGKFHRTTPRHPPDISPGNSPGQFLQLPVERHNPWAACYTIQFNEK